jgi:hypothetical protein
MKKFLLLLPFLVVGQQALALDSQDEENYKQHYSEQLKPLVIKKLSADRPDMSAKAIKSEANAYVAKMAGCQLEAMNQFPEHYQEKAILPVAQGADVATTTQALNQELKQDIEAGKVSKEEVMTMIQIAQETVQICVNS